MLFPDDAVLTRQLPAFVVVDVISREIRNWGGSSYLLLLLLLAPFSSSFVPLLFVFLLRSIASLQQQLLFPAETSLLLRCFVCALCSEHNEETSTTTTTTQVLVYCLCERQRRYIEKGGIGGGGGGKQGREKTRERGVGGWGGDSKDKALKGGGDMSWEGEIDMQNPSTGELIAAPPRARDRLEDAAAAAAEHGSFHSITSADQASGSFARKAFEIFAGIFQGRVSGCVPDWTSRVLR